MKINHNMGAMNSKRNMKINNKASSKSMEKLSSGLRISSAGDDVAGLSISEKMRAQIRGLEQASRNAADGICLIQTADGALNETHSIIQRMRDISVQAANDANTESDRKALQEEMNELTSEINRIANTTEFNTKKILTGGQGNGVKAINLDFNGTEVTHTKGNDAITKNMKVAITLDAGISSNPYPEPDRFSFQINGIDLGVTYVYLANGNVGDITYGVKDPNGIIHQSPTPNGVVTGGQIKITNTTNGTLEAKDIEKVAEATAKLVQSQINTNPALNGDFKAYAKGGQIIVEALDSGNSTGANATMNVTGIASANKAFTVTDVNTGGQIGAGGTIAGQDIPAKGASTTIDFSTIAATKDDIKALVDAGMSINGQTIQFFDSTDGPYMGKAIGIDIKDATNAKELVQAIIDQTKTKLQGVDLTSDGNKLVITSQTVGENSVLEVFNGNSYNEDIEIKLQVGSNKEQSMLVSIGNMRARALGLVGAGAGFTKEPGVTDGTDTKKYERALDVTTSKSAESAIKIIDEATKKVSDQRAALGAYQNRLQYVVNNLDNSAENTISSESKIRDTDMALEVTKNAKNDILLQAAQSMMAQANSAPEQIIQLLK